MVQPVLLRFVRAAAEGDRFAEAKQNVDKIEKARLREENLDPFVQDIERFLGGMAEVMGTAKFADTKNAVHLSGPGWAALGAVFHDLNATLNVKDLGVVGRQLGEIDWQRGSPFWTDVMREKTVRGRPVLTFIGGGYESRQAIRRKMHEHLGTWDKLQAALHAQADEQGMATEMEAA